MDQLQVAVDMDGVVYDFIGSVRTVLLDVLDPIWVGEGTGIQTHPMPTNYDWSEWDIPYDVWNPVITDRAFEVFSTGSLLPGAEAALKRLKDSDEFDFFFLTRPWGQPGSDEWDASLAGKRTWLSSTPFGEVSIVGSTSKRPSEHSYDVLIDDNARHIEEAIEGRATPLRVRYPTTSADPVPEGVRQFDGVGPAVDHLLESGALIRPVAQ